MPEGHLFYSDISAQNGYIPAAGVGFANQEIRRPDAVPVGNYQNMPPAPQQLEDQRLIGPIVDLSIEEKKKH